MSFKDSKTRQNLKKAFTNEATAYLKYTLYKSILGKYSRKFDDILDIIIHQEKEHSEIWLKNYYNNELPSIEIALLDSISSEQYEHNTLYKKFGDTAKNEGYNEIASLFYNIAEIEGRHSLIFEDIKKQIQDHDYYTSEKDDTIWIMS